MQRSLLAGLIFLAACAPAQPPQSTKPEQAAAARPMPVPRMAEPDSIATERARYVSALMQRIAGREQQPAESVFRNIKTFRGVPAGRLVRIMDQGFARSLGVSCTHCHVENLWASEVKPEKQVARDMWAMVGRINNEQLKAIPNLKGTPPTVNCTTCHRGAVKPALNLPG